jgi:hypothetical protein
MINPSGAPSARWPAPITTTELITMSPKDSAVDGCHYCHSWGAVDRRGRCTICAAWKVKGCRDAHCLRCEYPAVINTNGVYCPCLLAIRGTDPEWYFAYLHGAPRRSTGGQSNTKPSDAVSMNINLCRY